MIERQTVEQAVARCLSLPGTEAVSQELNRRRERNVLKFAKYAMQPAPEPDRFMGDVLYWMEANAAMAPKWAGRLAIGSACIILPPQDGLVEPDITVGIGIWLAPEQKLV